MESHESQISNDAKIVQNGVHHAEIGMSFGKAHFSAKDQNSQLMWVVYSLYAKTCAFSMSFEVANRVSFRVALVRGVAILVTERYSVRERELEQP